MKRIPVTSSNLRSVGYSPLQQILEVEFSTGAVYQYSGVPQDVYDEFMGAESKGSYFYQRIRSTYTFIRVGMED